ncbi:hypothetical protein I4U23_029100 [Adineta vaga]|nr:hypothetical protein I4U23_029100 [Adineta vaga]
MTRVEEKLYLQSVFNAIDEVYNLKNHQQALTYEERLRASFNKLLVPNWYNHDYTSINELRKTKSYGQVLHTKPYDYNNNHPPSRNDTSDSFISSSISNDQNRRRSQSQTWSERRPLRHNSTASSYDTNGNVVINGRRSLTTYAPGLQRVAQSSTWYKPKTFTMEKTINHNHGHSIIPPKPRPRYSKIDEFASKTCIDNKYIFRLIYRMLSGCVRNSTPISNENIRHPIKPRTMAQLPMPTDDFDEEIYLEGSSDGDVTIVQKISPSRPIDVSSLQHSSVSPTSNINITNNDTNDMMNQMITTIIPRTNSNKNISSDVDSYRSVMLPPINDPSTASYHTARENDASNSGYKTPTPQPNTKLYLHIVHFQI